ncbi:MAG: hypothetical protein JNK75_05520 [Betaproteobacteria bacterium]|nr:hypothetical protein [Betaproteobacteria bacterium]
MKPYLKPLAAACIAALAAPAQAAITQSPQIRQEHVEVVVDRDIVVESDTRGGHAVHIEKLSAAGEAKPRSEVRVYSTHGASSGGSFEWTGTTDIDAIVSNAMSEAFAAGPVSFGRSVKNSPYSAEIITERTQTLADGNQITKRTTSGSWRDSAGRTRQETRDASGNVKSIHIHDAVDGARITLTPATKTARKMTVDKDLHKRVSELKEKARAMVKEGKATIIERGNPGEEIIIQRSEGGNDVRKEIREDVQVRVIRGSGPGSSVTLNVPHVPHVPGVPPIPPIPPIPPLDHLATGDLVKLSALGTSLGDAKWSSKATTTPLGIRDFDGVRAEGKSKSYTIPAGEIGNKNPITVTTESWYSPELQATVYSKHSDPRSGDTVYRMANIKRGEPSASLFTVPDGYTVKETPGFSYSFKSENKGEKK